MFTKKKKSFAILSLLINKQFFTILLLLIIDLPYTIRLETVNLKKIRSLAKVIGTAITVGGAMVMTLYKGPAIELIKAAHTSIHGGSSSETTDQHWVTGTLAVMGSIISWAGFFILQVSKHYLLLLKSKFVFVFTCPYIRFHIMIFLKKIPSNNHF